MRPTDAPPNTRANRCRTALARDFHSDSGNAACAYQDPKTGNAASSSRNARLRSKSAYRLWSVYWVITGP
jgi:hypothetical protein